MCLAAFIEEEELKLHQHKEINQSCAVINNRVIRSLVPQQQIDQRSGYCFIPIVLKASVTALKKETHFYTHTHISLYLPPFQGL